MQIDKYLIALSTFVAFGPVRTTLLLNYFGSSEKVWKATTGKLLEVGLSPKIVNAFDKHRKDFNLESYLSAISTNKFQIITKDSKLYPKELKPFDDAPLLLYVWGSTSALQLPAVALVGSRKMSLYGKEVASQFSYEIASKGVVVISGLARGIDTMVHEAALSAKGKTVAVLGSGLKYLYPPENSELAGRIANTGGAVISEYPLYYPPLPANFINRNRIISGISKAVIVVEGQKKSGTLVTASHAAEQGKNVYAIPGQINSPNSEAPHFLLKNGVKIATEPNDILMELK